MRLKIFLILSTLCFFIGIQGQMKISGKVFDEFGLPLAFTDVYIPETNYYVTTNSDGSFYLETKEDYDSFEVYQIDYEIQTVPLNANNNYDLVINLVESVEGNSELDEVVAKGHVRYKNKKENPAYQILREIWKRKKTNGLRKFDDYSYEEYEKIEFDMNNLDSNFINSKIFKDVEFVFNNIDTSSVTGKNYLPMFLNESIYQVYGENKPVTRSKKILVANKTSGFEQNEIVSQTVKNLYKEFNIYDNRLNFFNKSFVSPISKDGFGTYEYNIVDTIMVDNNRVIKIKYFPKRDNELTFKGTFEVVDSIFSIKSVNLQSTKGINVNFVRDIYTELNYLNINDSVYVPESSYVLLDMALLTKKDAEKGIYAHKSNFYKDYQFNIPNIDSLVTQKYNPYESQAFTKSDEYWANARHIALSNQENDIYTLLDTLKTVKRFKKAMAYTEIFGSGYVNILKSWDLGNIYSTFGYNPVEGIRLRTGGRTYFSRNDMWRLGGYIAYGFKDQKFKYGAELRYLFNTNNRFSMGVGYKKDIEQLAAQLTTDQGILTRSFASSGIFSRGNIGTLSNIKKFNFMSEIEPWENIKLRLDLTHQDISSANPTEFTIDYLDRNGAVQSEIINSSYTFSIIAKPNAKYSQIGIDRYEHSSLSPLIVIKYTKALKGIANSNFDYDKIEFLYSQPVLWGSAGQSDITVEAGKLFGKAPLSFLAVLPGNQSYSIVPGTFAQLNYYEFVTDTYFTLNLDHHFNGRFFSYIPLLKKLKLREVAFFRTAWGDISDKNMAINRSSIAYKAPNNDIYYEYGFGIENIGLGNLRMLRIDFNWRGNYLEQPEVAKFGVKFGFNLSF